MGNRQKSRKQIKELNDDLVHARLELEMEQRKHKTTADLLAKSTERITIMEEELLPLLGIKTRACPKCRILVGDDQRVYTGRDPRRNFPQYRCLGCNGRFDSGEWAVAFREVLVETMKRVLADMLPKNGDTFHFRQEYGDKYPVPITATEIMMMEKRFKEAEASYGQEFFSHEMFTKMIEKMKVMDERAYFESRANGPMKVSFSDGSGDPTKW